MHQNSPTSICKIKKISGVTPRTPLKGGRVGAGEGKGLGKGEGKG